MMNEYINKYSITAILLISLLSATVYKLSNYEKRSAASEITSARDIAARCFLSWSDEPSAKVTSVLILKLQPVDVKYEVSSDSFCAESERSIEEIFAYYSGNRTEKGIVFGDNLKTSEFQLPVHIQIGLGEGYAPGQMRSSVERAQRVCGLSEHSTIPGLHKRKTKETLGCSSTVSYYFGNIEKNDEEIFWFACPKHTNICKLTLNYHGWRISIGEIPIKYIKNWDIFVESAKEKLSKIAVIKIAPNS